MRVKKDDTVVVIAGKDKGKKGKVWICNGEVLPTRNGVNPREERKDNRRDRRDNKRRDNRRDNRRNSRGNDRARGQRPQRSEKNN